jgi:hypothetical protein
MVTYNPARMINVDCNSEDVNLNLAMYSSVDLYSFASHDFLYSLLIIAPIHQSPLYLSTIWNELIKGYVFIPIS